MFNTKSTCFDLGQGLDYVYHGTTVFKGIHRGDILYLSVPQRNRYEKSKPHEIYPEYWIIKAGIFDEEQVNDDLDQWIYFFKTGYVFDDFTADGLNDAKELLDKLKLPEKDRAAYERYEERMRQQASIELTRMIEVQEFVEKEVKKEKQKQAEEIILNFYKIGVSVNDIANATPKTVEQVQQIIDNHTNKK